VATHEAGHGVLHELWFADRPIEQVTITPRGDSEGFMAIDTEAADDRGRTAEHLRHEIGVLLGGRLAEVLAFGPQQGASVGASDDLRRARNLAFMAVAHMGLDAEMGLLSLRQTDDEDRALMPEALKQQVWQRVRCWLDEAEALARAALQAHWPVVQALADELLAADHVPGTRVTELVRAAASSPATAAASAPASTPISAGTTAPVSAPAASPPQAKARPRRARH